MNAKKVWCLIDPQTNSQAGVESFEKCIEDLKCHNIEHRIIKKISDLEDCYDIDKPVFIAFANSRVSVKIYNISSFTSTIIDELDDNFSDDTFIISLNNTVIGEIKEHRSIVLEVVVKPDGWWKFDDFIRDSKKVEPFYDLAGNVIIEVGQTKTGLPCQKENSNRSRPMLACRRLHLLP